MLLSGTAAPAALANDVIVGANVVAVDQASEQDRDALIEQLQHYGVKTIRMSLGGHGDRYTTFAVKAYQHGINAVHTMLQASFNSAYGEHSKTNGISQKDGSPKACYVCIE